MVINEFMVQITKRYQMSAGSKYHIQANKLFYEFIRYFHNCWTHFLITINAKVINQVRASLAKAREKSKEKRELYGKIDGLIL